MKRLRSVCILLVLVLLGIALNWKYVQSGKLIEAIKDGDRTKVGQLLDAGVNPNIPSWRHRGAWRYFNTLLEYAPEMPLSEACGTGDLELVQLLLDHGADPLLTQEEGLDWSALETTILHSHQEQSLDILKLLLEYGADPAQVSSSTDPAILAADHYTVSWGEETQERIVEMVRLLMEGRDMPPKALDKLLMHSAISGNLKLVEYMLSLGADPMFEGFRDGMTAYDYAVSRGHEDVALVLKAAMDAS